MAVLDLNSSLWKIQPDMQDFYIGSTRGDSLTLNSPGQETELKLIHVFEHALNIMTERARKHKRIKPHISAKALVGLS